MGRKIKRGLFAAILLAIVILLFTIIDFWVHSLESYWGVPEYYFRNKIPFGFLWAAAGYLAVLRFRNIWVKALLIAGLTAVTLQFRYFLESYALSFVLIFLLFHFLILYVLTVVMLKIIEKYGNM